MQLTNHKLPAKLIGLLSMLAWMTAQLPVQSIGLHAAELQPPRDVAFTSKVDSTEQRYVLMLPTDLPSERKVDLMIALHGHGSDRWQFVQAERDECRAAREMAAKHNMIYLCPDYRAKTSWMSPDATADLCQILEDVQHQFSIRRVLLCGGSMGGSSALAFATMHPAKVNGVVSMNGTANMLQYPGFTAAIEQAYGASKRDRPELYRQRSAELSPERLQFPVATTTGGRDEIVPPDSTLRLIEKLKQQGTPCLSIHRPEGGHSTNFDDASAAIQFVLAKW